MDSKGNFNVIGFFLPIYLSLSSKVTSEYKYTALKKILLYLYHQKGYRSLCFNVHLRPDTKALTVLPTYKFNIPSSNVNDG